MQFTDKIFQVKAFTLGVSSQQVLLVAGGAA